MHIIYLIAQRGSNFNVCFLSFFPSFFPFLPFSTGRTSLFFFLSNQRSLSNASNVPLAHLGSSFTIPRACSSTSTQHHFHPSVRPLFLSPHRVGIRPLFHSFLCSLFRFHVFFPLPSTHSFPALISYPYSCCLVGTRSGALPYRMRTPVLGF
jgi:hypothetical protein